MDAFSNFARVDVSTGYSAAAVTVILAAGHGDSLPAAPCNLTWWNHTDYPDPSDDPNREIVRLTNRVSDTLTVTRAQEGTAASAKNTVGKTYRMLATLTAATLTEVRLSLPTSGSGSPEGVVDGHPGRTYYDTAAKALYCKSSAAGTLTGWE